MLLHSLVLISLGLISVTCVCFLCAGWELALLGLWESGARHGLLFHFVYHKFHGTELCQAAAAEEALRRENQVIDSQEIISGSHFGNKGVFNPWIDGMGINLTRASLCTIMLYPFNPPTPPHFVCSTYLLKSDVRTLWFLPLQETYRRLIETVDGNTCCKSLMQHCRVMLPLNWIQFDHVE